MTNERKMSSALADLARTLLSDVPIQQILDRFVVQAVAVLPVSGAGVTLLLEDQVPVYIAASDQIAQQLERCQTRLTEGPCLEAFQSGEAVLMADLALEDRFPDYRDVALSTGMRSVFSFPIRHEHGTLGALDLYREMPGPLDSHEQAAAQLLADVAAAYVINAEARERALQSANLFRDRALHDPLTGLANRRLLFERLEHAAQRAQRSHTTTAVLFADLDRFKDVNDTHGHAVGDALLTAVAHRLATVVRPGDTLARVSGDEFVILCEDLTREADTEQLLERLRAAFSSPFSVHGRQIPMTASIGIAYAGPGEKVGEQLINAADSAMYEAKRGQASTKGVVDLLSRERSRGEADAAHHPP